MINQLVLRAGCSVLSLLKVERVLAARLRLLDAAVILNLHRVTPRPNPFWPGLHPDNFDELLRFATRTFDVVTIAELSRPRPLQSRKRPRLVLSFDDGYHDFLEHAVPLLARHQVRANQNVITGCVSTGKPPWNVQMYDFLLAAPPSLLREVRVPGFGRAVPTDAAERTAYGLALSAHLKNRPGAEREVLFAPIAEAMRRMDNLQLTRMMTAAEVNSLATTHKHEIGSHSHSHESMGHESQEFFRQDFELTRAFFAETLGMPLTIYAFPNGSHRREQVQLLLEAGIRHVLLVDEQLSRSDAPQVVPRITFHARSAPESRLRALGWHPRGVARLQAPLQATA